MILNDKRIRELCVFGDMISPFYDKQKAEGKISYGLSSFGYDARLDRKFKIFTNINSAIIDPKNFSDDVFVEKEFDEYLIPPNSFVLARTMERFKMPRTHVAFCLGKSTYARCGLVVNVTPLEPEWEGHVTIELSNTAPSPIKVYAGEGICQFVFFEGNEPEISYADRGGKYQGQIDVTLPRIKG